GGPVAWTAVVASDHDYFEDVVAAGGPDSATLTFPDYCPERRFRLAGPEMRIGRRSASQGLEPEIDLPGPPTDPGVLRLPAAVLRSPARGRPSGGRAGAACRASRWGHAAAALRSRSCAAA